MRSWISRVVRKSAHGFPRSRHLSPVRTPAGTTWLPVRRSLRRLRGCSPQTAPPPARRGSVRSAPALRLPARGTLRASGCARRPAGRTAHVRSGGSRAGIRPG
ncbi:hypothetical protein G6F57_023404 [Rhizopus arrhizus]|nr:hypothetical protein G6F57_023404 [Rhizopus arrhizus]